MAVAQPAGNGGHSLEEVRSLDDNRHAAGGITEIQRAFSADPDRALRSSNAGGDKPDRRLLRSASCVAMR